MKTLNSIFVDRRLATSFSAVSQGCDIELAMGPGEWLCRLNYLRSICNLPAKDPFGTNQESSAATSE